MVIFVAIIYCPFLTHQHWGVLNMLWLSASDGSGWQFQWLFFFYFYLDELLQMLIIITIIILNFGRVKSCFITWRKPCLLTVRQVMSPWCHHTDFKNWQGYTCVVNFIIYSMYYGPFILKAHCKKDINPLLMHWGYISFALSHQYDSV